MPAGAAEYRPCRRRVPHRRDKLMGIDESMGKAVENAMEDLGGTSEPADDAHAPEPGASDDDVQLHSSISEGSNARDNSDAPRTPEGAEPRTSEGAESTGATGASGESGASQEPGESAGPGSGAVGVAGAPDTARDVAGPAGLPDPDPDELRADPSEADQDPGAGLGRG